ncbi:MAG: lysophospholipid acyltransferase family protein [Acidimicrobiales bacterium]
MAVRGMPGAPAPPTRTALALYALARSLVVGLSRLLWHLEVTGLENVPATGACIVAPVHRSNIDTLVVAGVTDRRLRYMGKDALWSTRPSAWLLSALGGFPVHRGVADREAMKLCLDVLAGGEPLVVFPEGQRREGPRLAEIFEGAAYLASRAAVPVVPVGIGGSAAALPRGAFLPGRSRVRVVIGPPMPAPAPGPGGRVSRSEVRKLTAELSSRLQELFDEAKVGAGPPARRARGVRRLGGRPTSRGPTSRG